MKNRFLLLFCFSFGNFFAQITFSEQHLDLGTIPVASEIQGDMVLTNTSDKKVFLMRADADYGVKVYTSKKTLKPNDTCLIVISFVPEKSGKFTQKIKLIVSDKAEPYNISLSGNILNVKANDKQACFYFGSRKNNSTIAKTSEPVIVPETEEKRDNSNRIPDESYKSLDTSRKSAVVSPKTEPEKKTVFEEKPKQEIKRDTTVLTEEYLPNNILFLVDVSSSMKDSVKLPLMKLALHRLIDAVRDVDTITFVTYASITKVLAEAVSGADKEKLHSIVDSLKSKGATGGKQAIMKSQVIIQKHFISQGNNQILLASDGAFSFEFSDYKEWKRQQGKKPIVLTTIAFGDDREAVRNLRGISTMCGGSFIHIKTKSGSQDKLLEEIKMRSKKKQ